MRTMTLGMFLTILPAMVAGAAPADKAKSIADGKRVVDRALKYLVSHEGVTCAIPGMAKLEYVVDNLGAATGRLPDAAMRRRMGAEWTRR